MTLGDRLSRYKDLTLFIAKYGRADFVAQAGLEPREGVASLFDRFKGATRHIDAARILQEFRRSLMSELDYREEARNLVTLSQ